MGFAIIHGFSVYCCFPPPPSALLLKRSYPPPILRLPTSPPVTRSARPPFESSPFSSFLHLSSQFQFRSRTLNLRTSTHPRTKIGIAFANLTGSNLGENIDSDATPPPSSKEASFDIKLPRRSLIVQFTCNACGERTHRTINRAAYERGTVFLQCAGCLVYHKFVDNLGLVIEYDLRED